MKNRKQTNVSRSFLKRKQERGSVLLLVIGVLLLLMVLGTAFIQLVRQDRNTVTNLIQAGHINQIGQSAVDAVVTRLKEDVVYTDQNGKTYYFGEIPAYPVASQATQGPQEAYDYPGRYDRWLAATYPSGTVGSPLTQRWGQVSLIGERYAFMEYSFPNSEPGRGQTFHYQPSTVDRDYDFQKSRRIYSTQQLDTNSAENMTPVPLIANPGEFDNLTPSSAAWGALADADGDGYYDSIWENAPIPQLHGKRYFVAYRVIDNSSMVNMQTALGAGNILNGLAFAQSSPTFENPSEVDFVRYLQAVEKLGTGKSVDGNKFANYLSSRFATSSGAPALFVPTATRELFWREAGQYFTGKLPAASAQRYNMLGIENEFELRHRNGLNNESVSVDLENHFPWIMRRDTSGEIVYYNIPSEYAWAQQFRTSPNAMAYYQANHRALFTTVSGASALREPFKLNAFPNRISQSPMLKTDLNRAPLEQIFQDVLLSQLFSRTGSAPQLPPAMMTGQNFDQFSKQFAVNVGDYRDIDSMITKYKGEDVYGMEALPFITEIYSLQGYNPTEIIPTDDGMGNITYNVKWKAEEEPGYAIEIYNPFGHPIETKHVSVELNGTDLGKLNTLSGEETIEPGKFIVLYKQASGPEADFQSHFKADKIQKIVDSSTDIGKSTIEVRLLVDVQDETGAELGTKVAYSSGKLNAVHKTDFTETNITENPTGKALYSALDAQGNAEGINAMLVHGDDFKMTPTQPNDPAVYKPNSQEIGKVVKAGKAGDVINDPAHNQLIFGRFEENQSVNKPGFAYVGELAHLPIIGPNTSSTFAQQWAKLTYKTEDRGCMLRFGINQGGAGIDAPPLQYADPKNEPASVDHNTLALPHAMLIFDRFTTLSPHVDLVDNDVDGAIDEADEDELLIPGLLNINTVSEEVLADAISWPIPGTLAKNVIVKSIMDYRDDPTQRARIRQDKDYGGFASIAELFQLSGTRYFANTPGRNNKSLTQAVINPKMGMRYSDSDDQASDDQEERMMAAEWLSQLCTVRSDVFTAYILVRGYRSNSLQPTNKDVVEETRLIVVFDRSGLRTGDGEVKILGIYNQ